MYTPMACSLVGMQCKYTSFVNSHARIYIYIYLQHPLVKVAAMPGGISILRTNLLPFRLMLLFTPSRLTFPPLSFGISRIPSIQESIHIIVVPQISKTEQLDWDRLSIAQVRAVAHAPSPKNPCRLQSLRNSPRAHMLSPRHLWKWRCRAHQHGAGIYYTFPCQDIRGVD